MFVRAFVRILGHVHVLFRQHGLRGQPGFLVVRRYASPCVAMLRHVFAVPGYASLRVLGMLRYHMLGHASLCVLRCASLVCVTVLH